MSELCQRICPNLIVADVLNGGEDLTYRQHLSAEIEKNGEISEAAVKRLTRAAHALVRQSGCEGPTTWLDYDRNERPFCAVVSCHSDGREKMERMTDSVGLISNQAVFVHKARLAKLIEG